MGGRKLTVIEVIHLPELKLAGILFNCELQMCCLKKPAVAKANGPREDFQVQEEMSLQRM